MTRLTSVTSRPHVAFAIPATEFHAWQARLELQGVAVEEVRDT